MKRLLLLVAVFVLWGANSFAIGLYFDANQDGNITSEEYVYSLRADSAETVIYQDATNGVVLDGDMAQEEFSALIQQFYYGSNSWEYNDITQYGYSIYSSALTSYAVDSDGTTWGVEYVVGQELTLFIDADFTDGAYNSLVDTYVATLSITDGGTDAFDSTNSTPTTDFGVDLVFTDIEAGYFFVYDGLDYVELTEYLAENPTYIAIALADSSIDISSIVYDQAEDQYVITVEDNGTEIELSVVPEPSTIILLGAGLLGAGFYTRRRK